jgi:putative membrane protein
MIAAAAVGVRRFTHAVGVTASPASRIAPALALLAVLLQVGYPLVPSAHRAQVAVVIVAAFATACLAHAAISRSLSTALVVLACGGGIGLAAELIGVHTGIPFGRYQYSSALGLRLWGTPLIVALAWTMLAWPAAVVARRLVTGSVARVLVGAWALAAADLFLDPQLVAAGGWTWSSTTPHLPGIATIPLTNFAGWLVVSLVLSAVMQRVVGDGADGCALALYLWLWIGWTVAQVFFLDLRGSAAWGFVAMGCVAVPLVWRTISRETSSADGNLSAAT